MEGRPLAYVFGVQEQYILYRNADVYTYTHIFVCMCIYIYICICMYIYLYIYIYFFPHQSIMAGSNTRTLKTTCLVITLAP